MVRYCDLIRNAIRATEADGLSIVSSNGRRSDRPAPRDRRSVMKRRGRTAAAVMPFLVAFLASPAAGQESGRLRAISVTPTSGPSWLRVLAIKVDDARLGRIGGEAPPRSALPGPFTQGVQRALELAGLKDAEARRALEARFPVAGADLYRLDCRSCHGPRGTGEPPEVNSLIGPSRALSPALPEQNMRTAGRPVRADIGATALGGPRESRPRAVTRRWEDDAIVPIPRRSAA